MLGDLLEAATPDHSWIDRLFDFPFNSLSFSMLVASISLFPVMIAYSFLEI